VSQGRSGQVRKISPPQGFDPRTVQPVASRYTDYVTRPIKCLVKVTNTKFHKNPSGTCIQLQLDTQRQQSLLAIVLRKRLKVIGYEDYNRVQKPIKVFSLRFNNRGHRTFGQYYALNFTLIRGSPLSVPQ
jgi:hypothetical protein